MLTDAALGTRPDHGGGPRPRGARPASVLLVEDDQSIRLLLVLALQELGCRARESDGSEPPARLVADGPYSLVVSDLNLGSRSAREVLEAVRRAQPAVPILCISGYDDLGDLERMDPRPELLRKPFEFADLTDAVRRLLPSRDDAGLATPRAGIAEGRAT